MFSLLSALWPLLFEAPAGGMAWKKGWSLIAAAAKPSLGALVHSDTGLTA